jgi:hypothetical protein
MVEGTYASFFRLKVGKNVFFGPKVFCEVTVIDKDGKGVKQKKEPEEEMKQQQPPHPQINLVGALGGELYPPLGIADQGIKKQ